LLDDAELLHWEALNGRRETLGSQHPDTLVSVNDVGLLLQARGRLDEAEPLLREALDARHEMLGPQHPTTISSINSYHNLDSLLSPRNNEHRSEAGGHLRELLAARSTQPPRPQDPGNGPLN